MFSNSYIIFFLITLISTLLSISANSWIGAWIGLEVNMMSFIPLLMNPKNITSNESALKYFLIQALASALFLSSCLSFSFFSSLIMSPLTELPFSSLMMITPLMLKLGGAPFQFWFISIIEGLPWLECYILMTWQKIASLMLMTYILKNNNLIYLWSLLSVVTGAIGGFNQTTIKKILAYSSVNHIGWMIAAFLLSKFSLFMYLTMYFLLNFSIICMLTPSMNSLLQAFSSNIQFPFMISLLSMSGLPPLLGFFPKWMILQNLLFNSIFLVSFILIFMSLITLFFYTRMIFNSMILTFTVPKFNLIIDFNKNMLLLNITLTLNLFGLFLFNFFL